MIELGVEHVYIELIEHWNHHLDALNRNHTKSLIEIGAGKSLEQNLYFAYKLNFKVKQTLIDLNHMIDLDLVNSANKKIAEKLKVSKNKNINSIDDLSKFYNIHYKAPYRLSDFDNGINFDIC